jgi:hypothetical protein
VVAAGILEPVLYLLSIGIGWAGTWCGGRSWARPGLSCSCRPGYLAAMGLLGLWLAVRRLERVLID